MTVYIKSELDGIEYCKTNGAFTRHLRNNGFTYQEYHEKYVTGVREVCPMCGEPKKFYQKNHTYANTCGAKKCAADYKWSIMTDAEKNKYSKIRQKVWDNRSLETIDEMNAKRKDTNNERYGGNTPMSSSAVREKVKSTNNERYGGNSPFASNEVQEKQKETVLSRYGVEHPMQSDAIKQRLVATNLERYGVPCTLNDETVREKIASTNIERYGTAHPIQNDKIKQKVRDTNFRKFGYSSAMLSPLIKAKFRKTSNERYGVDNPSKLRWVRDKVKNTNLERYGVDNPSKLRWVRDKAKRTNILRHGHEYYSHPRLSETLLSLLNDHDWMISEYERIGANAMSRNLGIHVSTVNVYLRSAGLIRNGSSSFEKEIRDFLKSCGVNEIINNDRRILNGKEIDLYLPEYDMAIECNGSYWHSELNGRDKHYHLDKTTRCAEKSIQLIHIWGHDWILNHELIKSRLCAKLGFNQKIYARKCEVVELDNEKSKQFLDENHIQGKCVSSVRYGLVYNGELVSVMTFGRSRFNKNAEFELLRFCSKKGVNVIGGASRLFKRFILENAPKSVISYSDKMWNSGNLYSALGFEHTHATVPSYYYTKDHLKFKNRINYQKHKLAKILEIFDSKLSEWENMKNNGYDRIWDCGNDVWLWKPPSG